MTDASPKPKCRRWLWVTVCTVLAACVAFWSFTVSTRRHRDQWIEAVRAANITVLLTSKYNGASRSPIQRLQIWITGDHPEAQVFDDTQVGSLLTVDMAPPRGTVIECSAHLSAEACRKLEAAFPDVKVHRNGTL